MVVAATLCAGCEAYQAVSSRAGTISMMAKSKVRQAQSGGGRGGQARRRRQGANQGYVAAL